MFHENTLPDGMKDADKTNRAKPSRLESRGPKRKRQLKILFVVGMFVPGRNAVVESQVDLLVRQESGGLVSWEYCDGSDAYLKFTTVPIIMSNI